MLRLTTHSCSHADEAAVNDRLYDGYPAEAR